MGNQCHYMSKDDGPIEKVALNEWTRKRSAGYVFRTAKEFQDQQARATPERDADDDADIMPTMDNTKAEILEYAEANGITVDADLKKADLLAAIGVE